MPGTGSAGGSGQIRRPRIAAASAWLAARAAAPDASADRSIVRGLTVMPARAAIRPAARAKDASAPVRAFISARPGDSGRARHPELGVAGREPVLARRAVIPRPLQRNGAEHGGDGLVPAAGVTGLVAVRAFRVRPGVAVAAAGQHRFQQPGAGRGERRAHRLLQHAQPLPGPEHARGQPGQPAYLGGGDLLDPRREPPLSPPREGPPRWP